MPISQSRMIALIVAARAFEHGVRTARTLAEEARLSVAQGAPLAETLHTLVAGLEPRYIIPDYAEHLANLAVEEKHFQRFASYNAWRAEKQQLKRRDAPSPSRTKAGKIITRRQSARPLDRWITSDQTGTSPGTLVPPQRVMTSILDEAWAAGDPSMASDPESAGASAFLLGGSPEALRPGPGLTDERKAEIEAELDALEGRGEPGEVE